NPLADHPSVRLCRFARIEVEEMEQFGAKAVSEAVLPTERQAAGDWLKLLDDCLFAARGPPRTAELIVHSLPRRYSAKPFKFDPVPKRDARFPDPYNMAVNAEVFLYDPALPPAPKTLMMF